MQLSVYKWNKKKITFYYLVGTLCAWSQKLAFLLPGQFQFQLSPLCHVSICPPVLADIKPLMIYTHIWVMSQITFVIVESSKSSWQVAF